MRHANRVLRDGVDTVTAAVAALAQVRTTSLRQAGVGGREAGGLGGIEVRGGRMRNLLSRILHRLIPVIRPMLYRYREYMNRPILERLAWIESRLGVLNEASGDRLARIDRIESYALAAARRIAINCDNGRILVKSAVGYVVCSNRDSALLACLIDNGELESGTRLLIERLVRPGTTFVDVGANIGLHTLAAARAMHGVGKVVAFEPYGPTQELLSESVCLNGVAGIVEIHQAAVSSRSGICKLYLGVISGHHSIYPLDKGARADRETVDVRLVKLAEVIPPGTRVDLIKIDVEGAELDVLESAKPFIEANSDIALVVEFGPSHLVRTRCTVADWFGAFAALDLAYQAIDPINGTLSACVPELLSQAESTNLLFARSDSPIWRRAHA